MGIRRLSPAAPLPLDFAAGRTGRARRTRAFGSSSRAVAGQRQGSGRSAAGQGRITWSFSESQAVKGIRRLPPPLL
jgi:hypothetical protein